MCKTAAGATATVAVLPTEVWEMTAQAAEAVKTAAAQVSKVPAAGTNLRFEASSTHPPVPCRFPLLPPMAPSHAQKTQGKKMHTVVLINPVNEKANRFTSTEAMDYPTSNMREFETLVAVTKEVIKDIAGGSPEIKVKRIDEGGLDGDLCAIVSGWVSQLEGTCGGWRKGVCFDAGGVGTAGWGWGGGAGVILTEIVFFG